jgi:glycosyltransferase involved in cell wall biosynthesis
MHKISVIIPNYNHAKYLPECLDALLSQSYKADEILIVDDGSTDNSIEVIESFQRKAPEIVLVKNEKNCGVHHTFNKSLHLVKNKLIAGFSADDFILPGFFEKAMGLYSQNDQLAIVFADNVNFYDKKPYQFMSNKVHICSEPKIFYPKEFIELTRKTNFYIASCACIYNKDIVLRYGAYRQELLSLTDYYLNAQIAFRHPIGYIPENLSAYRLSSTSYGASIRFAWKKRLGLLDTIMTYIMKKEDKAFKRSFLRSGLLSFNGYFMLLYLFLTPKYWIHFPFIFYKVIKRKFGKY